jgi:hypothetical protein
LIDSLLAWPEQFTGEQREQEDEHHPGYPEEIGTVGFTASSQASRMLPSSAWLKRYVKLHLLPATSRARNATPVVVPACVHPLEGGNAPPQPAPPPHELRTMTCSACRIVLNGSFLAGVT